MPASTTEKYARILRLSPQESQPHLESLVHCLNEASREVEIPPALVNSLKSINAAADRGIRDYVSIDSASGFPSCVEMMGVHAEFAQVCKQDRGLAGTKKRLVRLLDSLDAKDIRQETLQHTVDSVNRYMYLNRIKENEPLGEFKLDKMLLEEGDREKMFLLGLRGYSPRFNLFMAYEIEMYVANSRIPLRMPVTVNKNNEIVVQQYFHDSLQGYFSHTASDLFVLLFRKKGITPRRVTQTTIGPFYTLHTKRDFKSCPLSSMVPGLKEKLGRGVLAVSIEDATMQYDLGSGPLEESGPLEDPYVNTLSHYFIPSNSRESFDNALRANKDTAVSLHEV